MRPPEFWNYKDGREAAPMIRLLLTPISWIWASVTARRIKNTIPADVGIPVICVGNVTLGGTGKTPVTQSITHLLRNNDVNAQVLSRGYKGHEKGPLPVHPEKHTAAAVGDEPLMMAQEVPVWIAAGRDDGARAMAASGVQAIVMDDGFQNPLVKKTLSLIVVDAEVGFGNGRVVPAGPLREPVSEALKRADAVVMMMPHRGYEIEPELLDQVKPLPVLKAWLEPFGALPNKPLFAFAGIGRPNKFFDAIRRAGGDLVEGLSFSDHHTYDEGDIRYLHELAREMGATLITTEKDYIRLPKNLRPGIATWPVRAMFEKPEHLRGILAPLMTKPGEGHWTLM